MFFVENHDLWKWEKVSVTHRKRLEMLFERGRNHTGEILEITGTRVCLENEFLVQEKSAGQCGGVFVGLGTDGVEKAVKVFLKAKQRDLAEHEVKLLKKCFAKAPAHVVRYWFLDDKSHSMFVFLIMELCEETLEKYVSDNTLDDLVRCAPNIVQQLLEGLAGVHREPYITLHRDLKPLNILRNVHNNWLLADFGIARILVDDKTSYHSVERGTEKWKAVESLSSDHDDKVLYTTKSDIQVGFC